MRIHLIATGGAVMHNLSIALHLNGHQVSGSDDEIYNPARERLARYGLLPEKDGWFPEKISADIEVVILGMHARADNPELIRAQELGIRVLSYPAFVYEHARNKTRCVIAGSHGKTTTTAMVMHCLRNRGIDFDYVVGAQLDGFDTMVRLSDAPVIVIEGDEYLSSPLDPTPKMLRYRPHIAVITGIAWDHINVFSTFEAYRKQFETFLQVLEPNGTVFWFQDDPHLQAIIQHALPENIRQIPFEAFPYENVHGKTIIRHDSREYPLQIFGQHNLQNARAAALVCQMIGVEISDFLSSLGDFTGAAKRLQILAQNKGQTAWLDFAHAPSKVKATSMAVKNLYPERPLLAVLELHTFSSLNKGFLPEYHQALQAADRALVYFSPHTLSMKKLPAISAAEVAAAFDHPQLHVLPDRNLLETSIRSAWLPGVNVLFMSSGTFDGLNIQALVQQLFNEPG